jgi:hypothetical protein
MQVSILPDTPRGRGGCKIDIPAAKIYRYQLIEKLRITDYGFLKIRNS